MISILIELHPKFKSFKGIFFDCDGVIWEESELLSGVREIIMYLQKQEKNFAFLSNNSTKTILEYIEKFNSFNIELQENQIITSTIVTIEYLKALQDKNKNIYVIGGDGLAQSLINENFNVVDESNIDIENIDAVVVGMDRKFTYEKLSIGLQACMSGARFIATNVDPQFPTPSGIFPGAGSMVAALERAFGRGPEVVCGKPNPLMAKILLERFGLKGSETILIGDRVSTDLLCAINSGIFPVLVNTGFGESEFRQYPDFPYYSVIDTLFDLFIEN